MLILKRLIAWIAERLAEGLCLGALLGYLLHLSLRASWAYALAVIVVLFLHGYYFTTAFFGLVWRSAKLWVYPAITTVLFLTHGEIIFLRLRDGFTPEAGATEVPFLLSGACVAFACSFAGARVLSKWEKGSAGTTPYLSAAVLTLFVFALANIAHFARVTYHDEFRPNGIPFAFYREGGFTNGYHWQGGRFLWPGVVGDVVLLVAVVALIGKTWRRVKAFQAREVHNP